MNSLEILKQQLIRQKQLLDEKGFPVNTVNTNPSPTEITNAIEKINFDFTISTATEEDVKAGKTFFSQSNELKTGTYDLSVIDKLNEVIKCFITGKGSWEIELPDNITQIKKYAFWIDSKNDNSNLFYKENLVLPPTVTHIQEQAFLNVNLYGTFTLPATCEFVGTQAFNNCKFTEVHIYGGFTSTSTYAFTKCQQLLRAYIYSPVSIIPQYLFCNCYALEELYLPPKATSFGYTQIYECAALKLIKFTSVTPPTLSSNTFQKCPTAALLVPLSSFDAYFNASNYLAYGNPMFGYQDFEQFDNLPTSMTGYNLTWYATVNDAKSGTNPITICPATGTMYAACTEI